MQSMVVVRRALSIIIELSSTAVSATARVYSAELRTVTLNAITLIMKRVGSRRRRVRYSITQRGCDRAAERGAGRPVELRGRYHDDSYTFLVSGLCSTTFYAKSFYKFINTRNFINKKYWD